MRRDSIFVKSYFDKSYFTELSVVSVARDFQH